MKERATTDKPHSFPSPLLILDASDIIWAVWTSSQNPILVTIQTFTIPQCVARACMNLNRRNTAMLCMED